MGAIYSFFIFLFHLTSTLPFHGKNGHSQFGLQLMMGPDPEGLDLNIGSESIGNQFQGGPCGPGGMIGTCWEGGGRVCLTHSLLSLAYSFTYSQLIGLGGAAGGNCPGPEERGKVSVIPLSTLPQVRCCCCWLASSSIGWKLVAVLEAGCTW